MAKEVCMVKGVWGCVGKGGMHDREGVWHRGAWQGCVHGRGHTWQRRGVCGREWGHAWQERRSLQLMVHILLECILVGQYIFEIFS